jgi:carbonyl reductase 1
MLSVAVVTGANQGLGLAVVAGIRRRLPIPSTVYLTGRDRTRVDDAARALQHQGLDVEPRLLDVTDPDSVLRFADAVEQEHGGIDVFVSNAAARITPNEPSASQVRRFVATNNLGTTRLMRVLLPLACSGGRYIVVARSFGTLHSLPGHLHHVFDDPELTLDDLDHTMDTYVRTVEDGRAARDGWPDWINIASKVGQVAAVRVAARSTNPDDVIVVATCPGLVDTGASRPWFADMTEAQSPADAAAHLVALAVDPIDRATLHGELVQFGRVLPWR